MKLSRSLIPDNATLQAFEAAARYGSFTQAATELNLSQSAVSRQVKDLETRLGLVLFERVRQRVVLSENGRWLLPEVQRLLGHVEDMTLRAIGARNVAGVLSIATLPTFGSRWLVPRLPGFLAEHPDAQVNVAARAAPFDFAEESFDLAIHYGQPVWPHASCHYLCSEELLPVATRAFAARFCAALENNPDEGLAQVSLLHLDSRPKLWAQWLFQKGGDPASAYRGHRFDQFSLIIEAASAGIGAALLPRYLIEQELDTGRLVVMHERPLLVDLAYYVVLPDGKSTNPLCQAFQAWIGCQVSKPAA